MQKVRVKIQLGNIRRNAKRFRTLTKKALCAVVKANAYGHGAEEVVNALNGEADSFAVAILEEATQIRLAAAGKDILVFTPPTNREETVYGAWNGFVLTVSDILTARLVSIVCEETGVPLKVHLKVNTGMNRYGTDVSAVGKICKLLRENPRVRVEGIYSHLYDTDIQTAKWQRARFLGALTVCKRYYPNVKAHLSATYGCLLGEPFVFDGVRVGLGLYGYLPVLGKTEENGATYLPVLEKGMAVYAKAISSRKYAYGGAGYGKVLFTQTPLSLTTCRYGYADGFLRRRENGLNGAESQMNALCMDGCVRGGRLPRGEWIPVMTDADKTAKETGTIPYEVLCAATRRAEYVYENE
ncbi:MAG: alanine racemase [Clostridia bacterium]|nr:alanine racemase [Clostridia bacterium]